MTLSVSNDEQYEGEVFMVSGSPNAPAQAPRPAPVIAASQFVERHFAHCVFAVLAGSAAAGTATAGSDLDIVVIAPDEEPRWATFMEDGWPVELFVLTPAMYREAFARNVQRRRPLLLVLCTEGVVLVDREGMEQQVRAEAHRLLDAGPPPLGEGEAAEYRYTLTWMRDDLADAGDLEEARLIAHDLMTMAAQCYLAYHRHWVGRGKWLLRDLRKASPDRARDFTQALNALARDGRKEPTLAFADAILELLGGWRFAGQMDPWH